MIRIILIGIIITYSNYVLAQEIIGLYDNDAPNSKLSEVSESFDRGMYRGVTKPTLEFIKPEKPNRTAIIVIAGGGYGVIVYNGEGLNTAKSLADKGISAFVLKYRLPNDQIMNDKKIGPLQDVQQSIKHLRENADKYGIDKNKIGVMGFSAGGHLASTAATHFDIPQIDNPENTNLRPDFQILVYPVITMQDRLTHSGSRDALLGKNPKKEIIDQFSNEIHVTSNTPITWLTHAADDKVVDVDNSIHYFESLRKNNVEVEMHIYPKGDHGFIFRHKGWMDPLFDWLNRNNLY
ncbi:MAG TPA: alpha/beta hydrolase [Saprospiraceae bacterium]|nr:alpha/beta hydrolase [Saprospiraceae bacterium]